MRNKMGAAPWAVAYITGSEAHPRLHGKVEFFKTGDSVAVAFDIKGLPENGSGFFGFHIHGGEDCGGEGFADTKGHYSRGGEAHPMHSGDLPPILSAGGIGRGEVLTDRFGIDEIIGKTVVIHSEADDLHSQPSGNSGKKIACGVIRRAESPGIR